MSKKFLGILFLIVCIALPIQFSYAASTTISIGKVTANPGDKSVVVPIDISGNTTGVMSFGFKISYDSSVLTPQSSVTKGVFKGSMYFNPSSGKIGGAHSLNCAAEDGTFCSIKFDINENAVKGQTYPIILEVQELKYYTDSEHSIVCKTENGMIEISGGSSEDSTQQPSQETTEPTTQQPSQETTEPTTQQPSQETGKVEVYCDNVSAKPGDSINIPVKVKNNTKGISTISMKINYDSNVMTPQNTEELSGEVFGGSIVFNSSTGLIGGADSQNYTGDGTLFYIPFKISENAEKGKFYTISLNIDELKFNTPDAKVESLDYIAKEGKVTILGNNEGDIAIKYGDVDGDGILTAKDASLVLQKVLNGNFKFPIEK